MQSLGFGFPFFLEKKVIGAFPLEGSEGKTFYCTCNRKELLAFPLPESSNHSSSPSFYLSSVAKAKENSFFFCPAAGYPLLSPEGGGGWQEKECDRLSFRLRRKILSGKIFPSSCSLPLWDRFEEKDAMIGYLILSGPFHFHISICTKRVHTNTHTRRPEIVNKSLFLL